MKTISEAQLHKMLREAVNESGSQAEFARQVGVSPQYMCDVIQGREKVSKKILSFFRLEKVTLYRRIEG